ncbi:cyclic peptide export ABC transporter [Xanthomonas campestris pv. raphani]|uniref:cyclic peptide export ABC transporter n=1 Tax=Xanthomonas campestris TaxID=339 RepID=UPI0023E90048|nr:cyclic peptide export ABC transporter [Xanthomonas campestris]MCW2039366.1 putative ATP-binding cassette transporter [Xanthomonas campestris]MEA9830081.1 cyclic peptide export ABC transporter [Xanthomonas campestris pv. raphani]
MSILSSFSRRAPNKVFIAMVLGILAGLAYTMVIPLVMTVLDQGPAAFATTEPETVRLFGWQVSHYRFAALFVANCVFILVARTASQVILSRVALDVTTDLRNRMYTSISQAPIAELERVGLARLVASITADVPVIVAGARLLPDLLTNAVTLAGVLGFLLFLSPSVFWFVLSCIALGVLTYQLPMLIARRYLVRARGHLDHLHEGIRGLVHGAKELKLSHAKRQDYAANVLALNERLVRNSAKTGMSVMAVAQNYGNLIVLFVIGAIAFVFVNYHAIGSSTLAGVIMALLYVTAPVAALLNFVPQLSMARVAQRKVQELFGQLAREDAAEESAPRRDWQHLRLRQVVYRYPGRGEEPGFHIGPIDLEINRGEIVFIVGGNGSGKSTLAKLLSLHYRAASGEVLFDDVVVDADTVSGFRNGICAIYSDYYLFDRPLGIDGDAAKVEIEQYLELLGLSGKVRFAEGRFSTLSLSDGQRRRLALLVGFLEDASLYVFDEWAADQDPTFKQVFYGKILQSLKTRGKAVVVISHDDRYFTGADRVVVMGDGMMIGSPDVRTSDPLVAETEN